MCKCYIERTAGKPLHADDWGRDQIYYKLETLLQILPYKITRVTGEVEKKN